MGRKNQKKIGRKLLCINPLASSIKRFNALTLINDSTPKTLKYVEAINHNPLKEMLWLEYVLLDFEIIPFWIFAMKFEIIASFFFRCSYERKILTGKDLRKEEKSHDCDWFCKPVMTFNVWTIVHWVDVHGRTKTQCSFVIFHLLYRALVIANKITAGAKRIEQGNFLGGFHAGEE